MGDLLRIRAGTYLGECILDCNETVTITRETTTYELTSKFPDPQHPDVHAVTSTRESDWAALSEQVDWDAFQALPSVIGQPDAADAGGEWIEITWGTRTRRIDFEMGTAVSQIDSLVDSLRLRRRGLATEHRR